MIQKYLIILFLVVSVLQHPASFSESAEQSTFDYSSFLELHGAVLLKDWHLPHGEDLSYWGTNRDSFFYKSTENEGKYKEPWWTKGDFNADGIIDVAYLLFKNSEDYAFLFVFLSKDNSVYEMHRITRASKVEGVRTLRAKKQQHIIDALKLFAFEGHAITYIWNPHYNKFIKIPDDYSIEYYYKKKP